MLVIAGTSKLYESSSHSTNHDIQDWENPIWPKSRLHLHNRIDQARTTSCDYSFFNTSLESRQKTIIIIINIQCISTCDFILD